MRLSVYIFVSLFILSSLIHSVFFLSFLCFCFLCPYHVQVNITARCGTVDVVVCATVMFVMYVLNVLN